MHRNKRRKDSLHGVDMSQEDVLYPSDALQPNDNVVYGLEKANYDVIKPHLTFSTLTNAYLRAEIPRTIGKEKSEVLWPKNYVTNCTKQQNGEYKMTTQAMKLPVKGFRRSISEKAKISTQTKTYNKTFTFTFNSTMPFDSSNMYTMENLTYLSIRTNANELDESDKRQKSNDNINDNLSTKGLVGLLIPEATATLPVNYHFINES
ncbi:unnamed protein product, partial [Brenthis ino]